MRYTLDYLNQQLRERDVFNIEEVLFAIVETNGIFDNSTKKASI